MTGVSPARKAQLLEAHRIRWELGFNDPTFIGWLTVAAYLLAAALAWRAAAAAGRSGSGIERKIWLAITAAMWLLAINKQLDLHVLVTDIGRYWAVQLDLYQQRRAFQKLFMAGVLIGVASVGGAGWFLTRGRDPALRLAFAGLAVCAGYILVRAASFHHTDGLMRTQVLGLRWNWMIELSGIGLTTLAAWRYRPQLSRRASPVTR